MYKFQLLLLFTILYCFGTVFAFPFIAKGGMCTKYANNCNTNEECCYFPLTLCLPDIENGTTCLSPLDELNLSPSFTGSDLIGPLLDNLGNASVAIVDIVQINGETVYNNTEFVTSSTLTD